ncbi:hypothetical protein OK351_15125 [Glutamicibacter sp. MNS18]|nr:hypothetical protein [Glutamicibacter sp. MNS18]MCW4466823.1 hypothetical protein [Glutamicibacter sp. MNS18]
MNTIFIQDHLANGAQWIHRSHYAANRNAALAGHYAGYKDTFLRV